MQFCAVAYELPLTACHLREHESFVYVYEFNAQRRPQLRGIDQRRCMVPACGTDTPVRRCADWKAWAVIWKLRPAPRKPNSLASSASSLPYLDNNQHFIVNYGDRYRHGEPIASGFVESAVNQVVSKRFVKRQQMAWRPRHAHNLLQLRMAVLNVLLRSYVERRYPSIVGKEDHRLSA